MSVKLFQDKTNIESVSVIAGARKTFRVCSLSKWEKECECESGYEKKE